MKRQINLLGEFVLAFEIALDIKMINNNIIVQPFLHAKFSFFQPPGLSKNVFVFPHEHWHWVPIESEPQKKDIYSWRKDLIWPRCNFQLLAKITSLAFLSFSTVNIIDHWLQNNASLTEQLIWSIRRDVSFIVKMRNTNRN